jgi:hypothetical protein
MAEERIFQGLAAMKQVMANVPEKYWDEYRERIRADELRSRLVAVYDKHFSVAQVKALLALFETPAGRNWTAERVPLLRDAMEVGQDVTRRAASAVSKEYQADQLLKNPRGAGGMGMSPLQGNPFGTAPASPPVPSAAPSATPSASP